MKHLHLIVARSDNDRFLAMEQIADALLERGRPFTRTGYLIETDDGLTVAAYNFDKHALFDVGEHNPRVFTLDFKPCKSSTTNPDKSGQSVTWQRWQKVVSRAVGRRSGCLFRELELRP